MMLKNQETHNKCSFIPKSQCSSDFEIVLDDEEDLAIAEDEESHL